MSFCFHCAAALRGGALSVVVAGLLSACATRVPLSDPSDSAHPAGPSSNVSSLEDYRPFQDLELKNWVETNEIVRSVGGHGGAIADDIRKSANPPQAPAGGHLGHH